MSTVTEQAVETVNIEVDGVSMEVPRNSMIIEATDKAGIAIPRFCYHKKLTIAANCRMCLVDVEKAPKPLPACATPVMEGMKVYTTSKRAVDAQHGVMEFLLINHPLDCPICDQGGECELQDQAMGYGRSVSRFTERKRVVKDKNVGPLIQTEMTRCIHCTRCVRFLEEIAGTSEMGGSGRGDRTEIGTVIQTSIDSELSGNVIDLCPVGALTNKPFRFKARAWEMSSKTSVATHDGVGSGLRYHTRRGDVMRAVPRDIEEINESWLSDRDRYSHFGLYSEDRALVPQLKQNGEWQDISWEEALQAAAQVLKSVDGPDLGILMSPSAGNEEYLLASRIAEGLGCENIDHRLREIDFADDDARPDGFEMPIADISSADAVFLLGSNIRHEAPILGHRVRQAWKNGGKVLAINPLGWNFHFDLAHDILAAPQQLASELAAVVQAAGGEVPAGLSGLVVADGNDTHKAMADTLSAADSAVVLVGQAAMSHEQAACLRQLGNALARATGAKLNIVTHGANSTGASAIGAIPGHGGLNQRAMLENPRKAYLLWDFEPSLDTANPAKTRDALSQAAQVVAVTSFASDDVREHADLILPLAPWAENEGSITNYEGRNLQIRAAGKPQGECRAGWKILRQLGHLLGVEGCHQVSLEEVQAELPAVVGATAASPVELTCAIAQSRYRIGEVPMYSVDALCRRSASLQSSVHADSDFVGLNPADASELGLSEGDTARVSQGSAAAQLPVLVAANIPVGGVWLRSATPATADLGDAMGPISVEKSGGAA